MGEGSFDAVALFVEGFVEAALRDAIAAWRDDGFGSVPFSLRCRRMVSLS